MTHNSSEALEVFFEGRRLLLYCSLDVFYGSLGISTIASYDQRKKIFFSAVNFSNVWSSKQIRIPIGI